MAMNGERRRRDRRIRVFFDKHNSAEVDGENDRQLMEWVDWGESGVIGKVVTMCQTVVFWTVRSLRRLACLVSTSRP
jgi:hypothetical protein